MICSFGNRCIFSIKFLIIYKVGKFSIMANTLKNMALAAVAALGMASAASAATLSIVGGTAGSIPDAPATNEVLNGLGLPAPMAGFFGSKIVMSEQSNVQIDVMGFEAGFRNTFAMGGFSFTSTPTGSDGVVATDLLTPLASTTLLNVAGGMLSFDFSTNGVVTDGTISNGETNLNVEGYANFFATKDANGAVWLFFDDGGGRDTDGDGVDDDNHDDLVIRISAVPLPAGAVLMLTGLGAFALRRRKES